MVQLLATVSASVRAGSDPAAAWVAAGVNVDPDGAPRPSSLLALAGGGRRRWRARAAGREDEYRLVLAVVVAARIAAGAGVPLAGVLDRVREACEAAADVEAERAAALAGPMASGRLLGWLPVGGLLLAGLLGADPVGSALGGGVGTVAAVAGLCLLAAGRWWLRHLVRVASMAGSESPREGARR